MSEEVTYTISEASSLTGLHRNTIRQRIRLGQLEASTEIGKYGEEYRIAHSTLEAAGLIRPPGEAQEPQLVLDGETAEDSNAPPPERPARRKRREAASGESLDTALSSLQELYQRHEQAMFRLGFLQGELEKVKALAASAESLQDTQLRQDEELHRMRMEVHEHKVQENVLSSEAERLRAESERLRADLDGANQRLKEMESLQKDLHHLKAMATQQQRTIGELMEQTTRPWWKFW